MSTSSNAFNASLCVERTGRALVVSICRPHAGNSIDLETADAIGRMLRSVREDHDLRAVIITGEGNRFFCTGGDLKAYRALDTRESLETAFSRVRQLLDEFEGLPLPVIAAIDGYALGGGLELALACDLRFAAEHAKLGMPQSRLGIIPGWNGVERLVELVGRGRAMQLLFSGEAISAADAEAIGLIEGVAKTGTAVDFALEFAQKLDKVGPLSLAAAKATGLATLRDDRKVSRELAKSELERLWFTADHREAEAAFAGKREPKFRGY